MLGTVLQRQGQLDEAMADYERAGDNGGGLRPGHTSIGDPRRRLKEEEVVRLRESPSDILWTDLRWELASCARDADRWSSPASASPPLMEAIAPRLRKPHRTCPIHIIGHARTGALYAVCAPLPRMRPTESTWTCRECDDVSMKVCHHVSCFA